MKILYSLLLCAVLPLDAAILLNDSFSYPDGTLTNVSNGKWRHTSGSSNDLLVVSEQLELTRSASEDVEALFPSTYSASSSNALFARFTLSVRTLPAGANGNYFAHFAGGSARARVFVTTNGAAPGRFRVGISSGSTVATNTWPADLETNQTFTVLARLVINSAEAVLWIDPQNESDPLITAADTASASSVDAFGWRQDSGMGVVIVDDLVVATSFVEALSRNETPFVSDIPDQQGVENAGTGAIPFTIGDAETDAASLSLEALWSNSDLVENVSFGGSESNRTVTVVPQPNQTGSATITILVGDGTSTNRVTFGVTIVPALLFAEDFSYVDGALAGSGPWVHHSGAITGQLQVAAGSITLASTQSEDVSMLLPGGPFASESGVRLFAGFRVGFSQLPGSSGDYFAHFNTSGARARVFANTANAAPGMFRLGVANGANSVSEQFPVDLATNAMHLVIVAYDPASAVSTLWVNPDVESDFSIAASDATTPNTVTSFAFRQDSGIGTFTIDDLRIGLTFASVQPTITAVNPVLEIVRAGDGCRIQWKAADSAGYVLEQTSDLSIDSWQAVEATGNEGGFNFLQVTDQTGSLFFRLRQ